MRTERLAHTVYDDKAARGDVEGLRVLASRYNGRGAYHARQGNHRSSRMWLDLSRAAWLRGMAITLRRSGKVDGAMRVEAEADALVNWLVHVATYRGLGEGARRTVRAKGPCECVACRGAA